METWHIMKACRERRRHKYKQAIVAAIALPASVDQIRYFSMHSTKVPSMMPIEPGSGLLDPNTLRCSAFGHLISSSSATEMQEATKSNRRKISSGTDSNHGLFA
eukprot:TRINITY_DN26681_c0_g2_i1.p1 TRINITY_DN26681_c0_g2~~TRINITY_DN26681_c0_g2_i1.p1  ORF type:complete len:104 (+),score=2.72 TRINITY_DN26681_c0_g2_i1:119-430(+)